LVITTFLGIETSAVGNIDSLYLLHEALFDSSLFAMLNDQDISIFSIEWFVLASDTAETTPSSDPYFTVFFEFDDDLLAIEELVALPEQFTLYQNYPNPFNPITNIGYDIPERTFVRIEIYDITGRLIKVFNEGLQEPGHYTLNWNALDINGRRLSGGMYIYRINTENFSKTRKMILLK
jgi:hypothetical protein